MDSFGVFKFDLISIETKDCKCYFAAHCPRFFTCTHPADVIEVSLDRKLAAAMARIPLHVEYVKSIRGLNRLHKSLCSCIAGSMLAKHKRTIADLPPRGYDTRNLADQHTRSVARRGIPDCKYIPVKRVNETTAPWRKFDKQYREHI